MNVHLSGECDKQGKPYLYTNLEQDMINYPAALGEYLDYLWEEAAAEKMSEEEIQAHLDMLGEWIKTVEMSTPTAGIWKGVR